MEKEKTTYRELMQYLKEMQESADMLKEVVYHSMEDDGFNMLSVEKFHDEIQKDDIEKQPDDIIENILNGLGDFSDEKIKGLCRDEFNKSKTPDLDTDGFESYSKYDIEFDKTYESSKISLLRGVLQNVLENMDEVTKTYKEVEDLKEQAKDSMDEYVRYLTSNEHLKKNQENIETLKKKASEMEDGKERKELEKKIEYLQASMDLSFITKRIESLGEKEIKMIRDGFFNSQQGAYVIKRFNDKIKKLGYNQNIHSSLLNIEETFLEEKYHVYNNLFLFHLMRYIGHIDVNKQEDRIYASTLIAYTGNLIYHKFTSKELEEKFLNIIRSFLDNFADDYDTFDKKNVLHPNHPVRLEKKKKRDDEVKKMIYANFENKGYEVTDEVRALDLDALRELYDAFIDDLKKKDKEETSSKLNDIITDMKLNSDTWKREKLKKQYMQYASMTEEINEKFETSPIEELEKMIHDAVHNELEKDEMALPSEPEETGGDDGSPIE